MATSGLNDERLRDVTLRVARDVARAAVTSLAAPDAGDADIDARIAAIRWEPAYE